MKSFLSGDNEGFDHKFLIEIKDWNKESEGWSSSLLSQQLLLAVYLSSFVVLCFFGFPVGEKTVTQKIIIDTQGDEYDLFE